MNGIINKFVLIFGISRMLSPHRGWANNLDKARGQQEYRNFFYSTHSIEIHMPEKNPQMGDELSTSSPPPTWKVIIRKVVKLIKFAYLSR